MSRDSTGYPRVLAAVAMLLAITALLLGSCVGSILAGRLL